jgi:cell division protein FtsW (lipid II flippase)
MLAPTVRERTWEVPLNYGQWFCFLVWVACTFAAKQLLEKKLPGHDFHLYACASLLSGWGVLTIWRLEPDFGIKQSIWLLISILAFVAILYLPNDLSFLRRYKYRMLVFGFLLTTLTLIFGTSPSGFGPRLWLGCCGIYLQPSEPLKLLLVIYLSAYLADRAYTRVVSLIAPSLFITATTLLVLLVQRDLGTASIFTVLFTIMVFLATGKKRILLTAAGMLIGAGLAGYFIVSIIQLRINVWINPWDDPAGSSFQIIQSLLAVANGGTFGRGIGIGNPSLVPVTISDFIFSAMAEETGLIGTVGLICIIFIIVARGMIASMRAPDSFRRLLAAGITSYIGIQSILIIGGNLRLLPLTGVTLPFVSYGGSSLVTSFIALALLLKIGAPQDDEPAPLKNATPYILITSLLGVGLLATSLTNAWWVIARGPDLITRTDNARRSIADRYVMRGSLLDRNGEPINITTGESGSYQRNYLYPQLSPVTGYTNPIYGQAGLEASLDEYLRGLNGNPSSLVWINHILYGTPPPGLDISLSIDLGIQKTADDLLGEHKGVILLMNAESGEILVMASHPYYDPNLLDEIGESLLIDKNAPLVNRATQGRYPLGEIKQKIISLTSGNPSQSLGKEKTILLLDEFGFFITPQVRAPVVNGSQRNADPLVTPLQMAIFASSISNKGIRPAPRIALAVETPQQGRVILPTLSEPVTIQILQPDISKDSPFWNISGLATQGNDNFSWSLTGTPQDWQGTPLVVVVLLEEDNIKWADFVGEQIIKKAIEK